MISVRKLQWQPSEYVQDASVLKELSRALKLHPGSEDLWALRWLMLARHGVSIMRIISNHMAGFALSAHPRTANFCPTVRTSMQWCLLFPISDLQSH